MSSKSCFLAGLAATLDAGLAACPRLAASRPAPSYQVLQLDLVDQDGVAYGYSMANDVSSPSQGPRQVVGYVRRHVRPRCPRVLDDQCRRWHGPVRTECTRSSHCQWIG